LLHEGLGCVALWRDFPEQLAAVTGCGVFLYSRLGYGGSSARALPWPLDYMQQEGCVGLPRVIEAAGIDDCVLIGHSDGASIALVNAGAVRAPQVKGLVVIAPHVFTEEVGLLSIRAAREGYRKGGLQARLAKYHGANVDVFSGWCDSWLHPDFARWNIEEYLPHIKVPVLQIQGTEDQYGSSAQVIAIARQVGASVETHLLQACKHAPQFEQTAETLRLISEFVARLVSSGSKPHYAAGPSCA
jgi:pimeloyl-ACP methyl ester carboxylesterase